MEDTLGERRECTEGLAARPVGLWSHCRAAGDPHAQGGEVALADLADFALRRHSHDFLLPRVWQLRDNLSAYDAVYIALAEVLDAPLLTRDRRMAAAAGHRARIEMV